VIRDSPFLLMLRICWEECYCHKLNSCKIWQTKRDEHFVMQGRKRIKIRAFSVDFFLLLLLLPIHWYANCANGYFIPIPLISLPVIHHAVEVSELQPMDHVSNPINGKALLLAFISLQDNIDPTSIVTTSSSLNTASSNYQGVSKTRNNVDQVERILDGNTIQLKKFGIVRLAGIQMPSGTSSSFQFPSCFSYSPSYKLRQLLPKATSVQVEVVQSSSTSTSPTKLVQVVLVRKEDGLVVNEELVKAGFARVVKPKNTATATGTSTLLNFDLLSTFEEEARSTGLGIHTKCEPLQESTSDGTKGKAIPVADFVAEFEPLEKSIETVWAADGGTQRIRTQETSSNSPPANPGDVKGCSDFVTYEAALKWYETYEPYYGDVAKLDRDGDGIPCPGLPHTSDQGQYRMKVPTTTTSQRRTR
jgi:endonuclease YncB( thermonuclease family)